MASQPLDYPSCGSVFRNPEGMNAWQLIDGIGYRGKRCGDVMVSDKHCNFILNMGTATAEYITPAGTAYVLGKLDGEVALYKAKLTDGKFLNNANKAYLVVANANPAAQYSFRFGEGTTGIEQITDNREQSTVIYDLTGRRIEAITAPGVYIVGGKKVLVK
jgi:hypothetical protein